MPNQLIIYPPEIIPVIPDPVNLYPHIHSDVIHSMPVKDLVSWVGEPPPANPLADTVTIGVSHVLT